MISGFEGGKNVAPGNETGVSSGNRILKVSAVTSGHFRPSEAKPAPDGYAPPPSHFVRPGDFLFSRANTRELVGATAIAHNPPGNLLLPDKIWRFLWKDPSPILPEYLLYFFQLKETRRALADMATGTSDSMRNISQAKLLTLPVLLPLLSEQRRIVDILNHAASIRRLRDEARAKVREIVPALFTDMFGADPFKRWPTRAFGDLVRETRLGLVRGAKDMSDTHPFSYIRMDAIGPGGVLHLDGLRRVKASSSEIERYSLKSGDFLFNTRNSKELVGKVAVFDAEGTYLFNNNIMAVRFNDGVNSKYIGGYFQTPMAQSQLDLRKSGTTSVYAIYYKNLATLPVPVPPAKMQEEFSERLSEIKSIAALNDKAVLAAEHLTQSMLAQVFGSRQSEPLEFSAA